MRIAIITFHNTMNFGASLQCVALSTYLTSLDNHVEVINYLPYYVRDKKSPFKEMRNVRSLKSFIKGIAYFSFFKLITSKDKKFNCFLDENVILSERYLTYNELKENPPIADLYICGSDQIWNPALTGKKFDEAFFLKFLGKGGKKVSYGVSVGEANIEELTTEFSKNTTDFNMVSVREKSVADRLSSALKREISVVLDPTLLLDKDVYAKMEKPCIVSKNKYLLLYNIQNSDVAVKIAQEIASDKGLELVDISSNPFQRVKNSIRLLDIGPGEFLTLFKNAEYVVTNSFHGTVFSIIYEKNFNSVLHTTRGGRVADLLSSLDLSSRIIHDVHDLKSETIDYENVNAKLNDLKRSSEAFLELAVK